MSDALEEHGGKVGIGGGSVANLRFADDMDALAEEEQELGALVEGLDKACAGCGVEIGAERAELMADSAGGVQRGMEVGGRYWVL